MAAFDKRTLALMEEFAAWKLLSNLEKSSTKSPMSEAEWARSKGTTDRTCRNWKKTVEFEIFTERLKARRAASMPGGTIPRLPDNVVLADGAAGRFDMATKIMNEGLAAGDAKILDLYLRTEGKEFIEAGRASRESSLTDTSDEALIVGVLNTAPHQLVADWLVERGWQCSPPQEET